MDLQLPPGLAEAANTYLTFSSDARLRRWTACLDGERQGLGQEPIVVGCLAFQVDLGALRASPDPVAVMAKSSAESEVGECAVVDVVEGERRRLLTLARVAEWTS